jgi:hypothetical protein
MQRKDRHFVNLVLVLIHFGRPFLHRNLIILNQYKITQLNPETLLAELTKRVLLTLLDVKRSCYGNICILSKM